MNRPSRPPKTAVASRESAVPSAPPAPPRTTGVYVDVENLRADAQQIVKTLVNNWPPVAPKPGVLCLYVRADFAELWRLWATSQFRGLEIVVKGVQHFSAHSSKNSADIAIATDAISDLMSGKVGHLAVLSDDSDFIALYASVRDLTLRVDPRAQQVPFLWIITDRNDTLSSTVNQYFPKEAIHVVPLVGGSVTSLTENGREPLGVDMPPAQGSTPAPFAAGSTPQENNHDWGMMEDIANAIIQQLPVGTFKSIDCQQVIRRNWPQHPLATASGPHFGTEFLRRIWPLLEERGARVANPGSTPRRYEMTDQAKQAPLLT